MIFVFGGEYQGKKDFVLENFGLSENEFLDIEKLCELVKENSEQELIHSLRAFIDRDGIGARAIYGLDAFVKALVEHGQNVDGWLEQWIESLKQQNWEQKIIIMKDVSQSLVPMDAMDRAFREANGRAMINLAKTADAVYRVFCGIGTKIK